MNGLAPMAIGITHRARGHLWDRRRFLTLGVRCGRYLALAAMPAALKSRRPTTSWPWSGTRTGWRAAAGVVANRSMPKTTAPQVQQATPHRAWFAVLSCVLPFVCGGVIKGLASLLINCTLPSCATGSRTNRR